MRLIVDTVTGLTAVDGHREFSRLDAVIIGDGILPGYIGARDEAYIWVLTEDLAHILDLQGDNDYKEFRRMIEYVRGEKGVKDTNDGEQIRVHVAGLVRK